MYTATRVDNSFHVSRNGTGKMVARTSLGIIRLIMTNVCAYRDLIAKGFVTITSDVDGMYCELRVGVDASGRNVILDSFITRED